MKIFAYLSLAFLWIFTGITSVFFMPEFGYDVLAKKNTTDAFATFFVYGGSALNLIVGVWLLTRWKIKLCLLLQALIIIVYTLMLSFYDPAFWFHPFGPVTKNIPILALIGLLWNMER